MMGLDGEMSGGQGGQSDDLTNPYAEGSQGPTTGDRSIRLS